MALIGKIAIIVVGIIFGAAFVKYSFQLTQIFGHNYYAERYLGDGGTYSMWKILGVIIIIGCVWYALR